MNTKESILQLVIKDPVAWSLSRLKFVPVSFFLQKIGLRTELDDLQKLIDAFKDIKGQRVKLTNGVTIDFFADPNFRISKKTLFMSLGAAAQGSPKAERVINLDLLEQGIYTRMLDDELLSIDKAKEFDKQIYQPLHKSYCDYKKLMAICNSCPSLDEGLVKAKITKDDWKRFKSKMARYGLS